MTFFGVSKSKKLEPLRLRTDELECRLASPRTGLSLLSFNRPTDCQKERTRDNQKLLVILEEQEEVFFLLIVFPKRNLAKCFSDMSNITLEPQ